jgi:hypothetical protein
MNLTVYEENRKNRRVAADLMNIVQGAATIAETSILTVLLAENNRVRCVRAAKAM